MLRWLARHIKFGLILRKPPICVAFFPLPTLSIWTMCIGFGSGSCITLKVGVSSKLCERSNIGSVLVQDNLISWMFVLVLVSGHVICWKCFKTLKSETLKWRSNSVIMRNVLLGCPNFVRINHGSVYYQLWMLDYRDYLNYP